jgi:hypothetical protein
MTTMLLRISLTAVLAAAPTLVLANDEPEYHFGFTAGTNVGEVGEKEIQSRLSGRFGKSDGDYRTLSNKLEAEFVPMRDFRLSIGTYFTHHHIAGVPGLDDRRHGEFDGLAFSFHGVVGLTSTLYAQPPDYVGCAGFPCHVTAWLRIDDAAARAMVVGGLRDSISDPAYASWLVRDSVSPVPLPPSSSLFTLGFLIIIGLFKWRNTGRKPVTSSGF